MDQAMGRNGTAGFKDFAGLAPKISKQLKDLSTLLPAANKLWREHAAAIGAAASALSKYNAARMPKEPTASRPGGGSGGGGGGGGLGLSGLGGLGRFAPHALALSMGAFAFNEARSALPAIWAQSLHGGPLRRGTFPGIEGMMDMVTGRDQREWMEDRRLEQFGLGVQYHGANWQARFGGMTSRHAAELSFMPTVTPPGVMARQLGTQRGALMTELGSLKAEHSRVVSQGERDITAWEAERRQRLSAVDAADHPALRAARHLKGMADMIPDAAVPFVPMAMQAKIAGWAAGAGPEVGKDAINQEIDARITQKRLELTKQITDNLERQRQVLQEIQNSQTKQLEIVKEQSRARQASASSFGMMSPVEQRATIDAAKVFTSGGTLSRDELSLATQIPEFAEAIRKRQAFQGMQSGGYADLLRNLGQGQRADQVDQLVRSPSLAAGSAGLAGIGGQPQLNFDLVVTLDEDRLAKALKREVMDAIRQVEVKQEDLANTLLEQGKAEQNRNIQRQASSTPSLGRK